MTCTCTILQSCARAFTATSHSHRIRMTGINIPAVCKIWCTETHGHYPWFRSWIRMSEYFFSPPLFSSFFHENQRQTCHQSFRLFSRLFCLRVGGNRIVKGGFNCLMTRKNCRFDFFFDRLIVIFKLRASIEHLRGEAIIRKLKFWCIFIWNEFYLFIYLFF